MTMYKKANENDVIKLMSAISNNPELLQKLNQFIDEPKAKKSTKSKGKAKRPLTEEEYNNIIRCIYEGFDYEEGRQKRHFNGNERVGLALILEATLGIRISDIVKLKISDFNNNKIQINEKKTNKLQYREVNQNLINLIYSYAFKHKISGNDFLIGCTERNIQIALKKAVDKLGYRNIGTHSFRKYFSMYVYKNTKDIQVLQHLLNHSSIATTQRYLGMDQSRVDEVSSSVDFTAVLTNMK